MKKKQLLTTLAVSTLVLAQAGIASADETAASPVDGTTPVVVSPAETPVDQAQPTQPAETSTAGTTTPPSTETPVDPTVPSTDVTTPSTDPTPAPSGDNTDVPTPAPQKDDNTGTNNTPNQPGQQAPSDGNSSSAPGASESTAPANEEPNSSKPTSDPTYQFDPFKIQDGKTVVGTQDSQVVVQDADGNKQILKAEEVGGKTNADGTVTLPTDSGEMKTLPKTGEKASILSSIGAVLLGLVGFIFKKKAI